MQPFEINQKQKVKLLEMCKKLFPEMYFNFTIIPTVGVNLRTDLYYYPTSRSRKKRYINWLEFCLIWLPKEMLKDYSFGKYWEIVGKLLNIVHNRDNKKLQHPVDFLYKEFEKIK